MNVLFIYSLSDIQSAEKPLRVREQIQFGISYISAVLKEHGHETRLAVLSRIFGHRNVKALRSVIDSFKPRLICLTAVSTEFDFITEIAAFIKNTYPDIYLLIGGAHVSLNPGDALSGSFNAVCIGEGELPTLELVSQLEKGENPSRIRNMWIKHDGVVEKNPTRAFLSNLDELPFPDRSMWEPWIGDGGRSRLSVLLGRGCPFQCTYCCNHAFRKLASGEYVRFRSADSIVKELKDLVTRFPDQKEIYFEVETIAINKAWVTELCEKLQRFNSERKVPLLFGCNLRITPNMDLDELFRLFKKSNFYFINIGVESGSERVRSQILRRHYSNEDIINSVLLARKYNLKVCFFNLMGIPGETPEDFRETVKINCACMPDWHFTSIFFPYPGTDLYAVCEQRGLLAKNKGAAVERKNTVLDLQEFPKYEVQKNFFLFEYLVYKGRRPMHKILLRILASYFLSNTYLSLFYRKISGAGLFRQLKNRFCEN